MSRHDNCPCWKSHFAFNKDGENFTFDCAMSTIEIDISDDSPERLLTLLGIILSVYSNIRSIEIKPNRITIKYFPPKEDNVIDDSGLETYRRLIEEKK